MQFHKWSKTSSLNNKIRINSHALHKCDQLHLSQPPSKHRWLVHQMLSKASPPTHRCLNDAFLLQLMYEFHVSVLPIFFQQWLPLAHYQCTLSCKCIIPVRVQFSWLLILMIYTCLRVRQKIAYLLLPYDIEVHMSMVRFYSCIMNMQFHFFHCSH